MLEVSIATAIYKLYVNTNGNIMTRLKIIFMTSSAQDVDQLDPNDLPKVPTALDVWILRDQAVLLTKNWNAEDQVINMDFTGFKDLIQTRFSQTLSPTSKPYHQCLVVINRIFKFINMKSDLV